MRYFCGLCVILILFLPLGCTEKETPSADKSNASPSADVSKTPPEKGETKAPAPDPKKIAGRWLRPDGGYILELGGVQDGGVVKAAYFNPNPINVAESKWSTKGSELHVYVKFDDVNYPGSYYLLIYNPEVDRLVGSYYQAVQKQTFSIEFVRRG